MNECADFQIRPARVEDVPVILQLIRDLATYERAPDEVSATEEQLVEVLFGEKPVAEVLLAFEARIAGRVCSLLLQFFHLAWAARTVSGRFVCEAGEARERLWSCVACRACEDRARSRLRPDGMGGARLERAGDQILSRTWRQADGRMDRVSTNPRGDREAGELRTC